jgi:hypothetical protein
MPTYIHASRLKLGIAKNKDERKMIPRYKPEPEIPDEEPLGPTIVPLPATPEPEAIVPYVAPTVPMTTTGAVVTRTRSVAPLPEWMKTLAVIAEKMKASRLLPHVEGLSQDDSDDRPELLQQILETYPDRGRAIIGDAISHLTRLGQEIELALMLAEAELHARHGIIRPRLLPEACLSKHNDPGRNTYATLVAAKVPERILAIVKSHLSPQMREKTIIILGLATRHGSPELEYSLARIDAVNREFERDWVKFQREVDEARRREEETKAARNRFAELSAASDHLVLHRRVSELEAARQPAPEATKPPRPKYIVPIKPPSEAAKV